MDSKEVIACKSLLDFEITNDTPWRLRLPEESQGQLPSFKKMMDDIVLFQHLWESKIGGLDPVVVEEAKENMLLYFTHNVNVEEGIGIQEQSGTKEIIDLVNEKAHPQAQGISPNMTRQLKQSLLKNKPGTKNLCEAWLELVQMATKERELDSTNCGLLEMELIKKINKTLMTGVIDETKMTAPGVFSTEERMTTFEGKEHHYPRKETQQEWEDTISNLLDQYNGLVEAIKKDLDKKINARAISSLFKCAAWFLFKLMSWHPFSDGNGRLCRLLASYILLLVIPFPSPIYYPFSDTKKYDYMKAIVRARDSQDHHPDHLAALMIESNWNAWKKILKDVGIQY